MTETQDVQEVTPFRAGGAEARLLEPRMLPAFTGPYVYLADVSEFQPDVHDAEYLRWSKAIVVRCAYGTTKQDGAWYGGQRRDLLHKGGARFVGIYQYLRGSQGGAAQADFMHGIVGAIRPGEVFIADFEEGQAHVLHEWYTRMHAIYGPGITPYLWTYSGESFGQAQGVLPVQWIAAYRSSEPSSDHVLWQFTSAFAVPGVGRCDCSVFHGTEDQLAALAYPAAVTPPPATPGKLPAPLGVSLTEHRALNGAWGQVMHNGAAVTRYRAELAHGTPAAPRALFWSQVVTGTHLPALTTIPEGDVVFHVKAAADGIDGNWSPWKAV